MKQSNFLKTLIAITIAVFSFLHSDIHAQERKSLTMPLSGGTLTFQYYEKDGVKVPDGPMEFKKANYTEKGECKDGYREGRWEAKREYKNNSEIIVYNFRKGLLEGQTTFRNTAKDKASLKYVSPDASYNFHNGRLIGENKIVFLKDTVYCNFGEEGKRIGKWKVVNPEKTVVFEYNEDEKLCIAYQVDILGQKESLDFGAAEMKAFTNLLHFDQSFREVIFTLTDRKRPKLPTLSDNPFGYVNAWGSDKKDEW